MHYEPLWCTGHFRNFQCSGNTAQVKGRTAIDPIAPPGPELVARSYLSLVLDFRHLHVEDILGEVASPVSRPLQIAKRDNWTAKNQTKYRWNVSTKGISIHSEPWVSKRINKGITKGLTTNLWIEHGKTWPLGPNIDLKSSLWGPGEKVLACEDKGKFRWFGTNMDVINMLNDVKRTIMDGSVVVLVPGEKAGFLAFCTVFVCF